MNRKSSSVQRLCLIGVLTALYFLLSKLTIPLGNLRLTLASLPIVVLSLLYGPWEATFVAFVGEFLIQLLGPYGLTPTTPLWCFPPVMRALVIGFGGRHLKKRPSEGAAWKKYVPYFALLMVGAIVTTLGNTAITWLDSILFQYYSYAYVFGQFAIRLVTGILTAVVVGLITLPILRALEKIKSR